MRRPKNFQVVRIIVANKFQKIYSGPYECDQTSPYRGRNFSRRPCYPQCASCFAGFHQTRRQIQGDSSDYTRPYRGRRSRSRDGHRTINADNVLLAIYAQLPAVPTRFVGSGNKFTYTLASNSVLGNGVVSYTMSFSGKRLNIVGNGTLSSSPVSIVLRGKKQGK
jgi:hypothetical protein